MHSIGSCKFGTKSDTALQISPATLRVHVMNLARCECGVDISGNMQDKG